MFQQKDYTDEDIVPLVSSKNVTTKINHGTADKSKSIFGYLVFHTLSRKFLIPIVAIFLISACVFVYEGEGISVDNNDKQDKKSTFYRTSSKEKVLSVAEIKERFSSAQQALVQRLKVDYGNETYDKMFITSDSRSQGKYVFQTPSVEGNSWNRSKRKMMMKLLQAQIHQKKISFIWATGGHSAAAGHGNFYDESYTNYLNKAAVPIFESVGLEFVARNYAMGGTNSAPEVAMCSKEIFGEDIDVLVWDFGMTDGGSIEKLFLYMYRGVACNKNRPIGLAYHAGGRYERHRHSVMEMLEQNFGLPVFQSSEEVMADVLANVPDTFGMSPEQIDSMPNFVRSFKCNNAIESGEPTCGSSKFNLTMCEHRKAKTSWHPGWKWHGLMGNLAALFLVELLDDALTAIAASTDDYSRLFAKLKDDEDREYENGLNGSIPIDILNRFFDNGPVDSSTLSFLVQAPVYCHTARLPAEIRHKGILTLSNKTGFATYDAGIELLNARSEANKNPAMQLVYNEEDREDCAVTTNMDHKDFFYVSTAEDWQQIEIPNDAELQEYGSSQPAVVRNGIVGICLAVCSWGHCPPGVLTKQDILNGTCDFEINGKPVIGLKSMAECDLFFGEDDSLFWDANENGRFVIRAKVQKADSYIRVSSFIVWTSIADLSLSTKRDDKSLVGSDEVLAVAKLDDQPLGDLPVDRLPLSNKRSVAVDAMLKGLKVARQTFTDRLIVEYGSDTFQKMFIEKNTKLKLEINRGSQLFQQAEDGESGLRFKRKAMIKLLQVLVQFGKNDPSSTFDTIPFVWATGGHSSAAGHGNLYDESFTAVLERSAKDIFKALGLNFTGRNYAMGGTKAAPEVALCSKEIFGLDVDALIWDFGMTDGGQYENEVLYFYRASLAGHRPACLSFHTGGSSERARWQITKTLDDLGITTLNSVESVMTAVLDNVPDSFGLSDAEIDKMPPLVQNFRCNGEIETGEPYCKTKKYNLTICPTRKYQANWHPGWRWHALMGYLATFFLIDTFESALIAVAEASDAEELLMQLMVNEATDYQKLVKASVPDYFQRFLEPESLDGFPIDIFSKERNFCHTAKLPAEIRHLGILTETNQTGFTTYYKGIGQKEADSNVSSDEFMRLVYNEDERGDCPVTTIMDYKDYFYLHTRDDSKKLILPNDAELKAYGSDQNQLHGLIMTCFTECPWGRCPAGSVSGRDFFDEGKFSFTVNGVPVTKLTKLHECDILTNPDGYLWKPNEDGRFEIKVKVLEPDSFIRISALIIW